MRISPLSIVGAWSVEIVRHGDPRGSFAEWFRGDLMREATGRSFVAAQANHSVSQAGVLRGIHFADVPPGQAKYVYCSSGAVLDVVVDVRVGSPTFGTHEVVTLSEDQPRAVFLAEGLGHAFCALRDRTSVTYLTSTTFNPEVEHTVSVFDAELAIEWPRDLGELVVSDRDLAAPALDEALGAGLLPAFDDCVPTDRA